MDGEIYRCKKMWQYRCDDDDDDDDEDEDEDEDDDDDLLPRGG